MSSAELTLLKEEPPLNEATEEIRRGKSITWYRTKLTSAQIKEIHSKSDLQGAKQTLGYLGLLVYTAGLAFYSSLVWPLWVTALLVLLHGTFTSFLINAVHELGHGTVFRTKQLNVIFCHIFAFPGWIHHEVFGHSHVRHHRYTLHPPDDLEVVLPQYVVAWHFLRDGIFNFPAIWGSLKYCSRIAMGRFEGEWELTLFPDSDPGKRIAAIRWARIMIAGHALIFLVSVLTGHWILFMLLSLSSFCGNWLSFLCGKTQHIGLQDNVDDFRLCTRTFTVHPAVAFLYWHMNYHIEHHMYAAVPCYRLKRLHELIRHDLPRTPHGLVAVWQDIFALLKNPGLQSASIAGQYGK